MKNILLLGLFSTILFTGCSPKQIEILEPQEIVPVEVEKNIKIETKESLELKAKELEAKRALEEQRLAEKRRLELKEKLDREALTNADKKLKAQEVRDYQIDENTPLILRNQSEEKAYE